MSKKKSSFNFKINSKEIISIIILFTISLFIGIISMKAYTQYDTKINVLHIKETLDFIGKDNPINVSLNKKIRLYDEKQEQARVEKEREIARRIAEEDNREQQEKQEEKKKETLKPSKTAYLTFDDGPSEIVTKEILKILDDYDIKATFFVLGKMAKVNPEILKLTYENGHSIGNHTYSHNYKFIYRNIDNFISDIEKADKVFKNILGAEFQTRLLRLPGGSFEKYKDKYVKAAEEKGYISYDWDALNGDSELPKKNKNQLIKRLKDTSKGKKELIVLMHDSETKINTVKALPEIIEHLISEGYTFKALEQ